MKVLRAIIVLIRELQRWRNRHRAPQLTVEVLQTPYWGGIDLPVLVRNTGEAAARDCRYCRRQRFSMPHGTAGAALTAETWYATGAFRAHADGSEVREVAYATADTCPRLVLADVPRSGRFEAAVVCRDRFGAFYRFRGGDGIAPQTDVWRQSSLGRVLHREAPEWTRWISLPEGVESREWTAGFA